MTAPRSRPGQPKPLDAGDFQPEVSSFRLHLAAEGKAAKTVRTNTEAVRWFAAAHLLPSAGRASWEQVTRQDVQEWIAGLLSIYSAAYASNQFRALDLWRREVTVRGKGRKTRTVACMLGQPLCHRDGYSRRHVKGTGAPPTTDRPCGWDSGRTSGNSRPRLRPARCSPGCGPPWRAVPRFTVRAGGQHDSISQRVTTAPPVDGREASLLEASVTVLPSGDHYLGEHALRARRHRPRRGQRGVLQLILQRRTLTTRLR